MIRTASSPSPRSVTTPTASTTGISVGGERAQQPVLTPGDRRRQLLQRVDRRAERVVVLHEAHDVTVDAAHDLDEPVRRPLRQRLVPGQVEEVGMPGAGDQLQSRGAHYVVVDRRVDVRGDPARAAGDLVAVDLRFGAEVRLDRDALAHVVARRVVGADVRDGVVLDLAVRVVAAEDPDPERAVDLVVLDRAHRHLGHRDRAQLGVADVVVADHHQREVGDDPLEPADDRAALDEARLQVEAERDVDPLRVGARQRADRAVADLDLAAADVDPVELALPRRRRPRARRCRRVHLDPVLAAADGHVADGDVVGRDHDPAADDRPGLARDRLRVVEDERPLVDPGREVDGRRLDGPGGPDDREQRDRRGGRERRAGAAELAAVLGPA